MYTSQVFVQAAGNRSHTIRHNFLEEERIDYVAGNRLKQSSNCLRHGVAGFGQMCWPF